MKISFSRLPALFLLFLLLPLCLYPADKPKSIAVLGFINTGNKSDNNINLMITKSLTTFLSKLQEISLTSYDAVQKTAGENRYWEQKTMDTEKALDMGLNLAASEIITGEYTVDKKKETIKINVYVYNPATSELVFKREYSGGAGMDLFDTVDKMIRNLSAQILGHPVTMGRLNVEVVSDNAYQLYIDSVFQKKLTKSDGYNEIFPANQNAVVSLRLPGSTADAYSETVRVKDGETYNISYKPSKESEPRNLYFPIHILEGGLGGNAGVKWYFTDSLGISALLGAVYSEGFVVGEAEANLSWTFLKISDFHFSVSAGGFCYFTSPLIVSPIAKLGISWNRFFVDGGLRYSFGKGEIYPMLSFGLEL